MTANRFLFGKDTPKDQLDRKEESGISDLHPKWERRAGDRDLEKGVWIFMEVCSTTMI